MLQIHQLDYYLPDGTPLFEDMHFNLQAQEKTGLIGRNGSGKSTLLRLINNELNPDNGEIRLQKPPVLIPQNFGQFDHQTIAEALGVALKISALQSILEGTDPSEKNFLILDDDWTIEERVQEALAYWSLSGISLNQQLNTLSGGEKTMVLLSKLFLYPGSLFLLDEPTNHLDKIERERLYRMIDGTKETLLIVSHDRKLLDMLPHIAEIEQKRINRYGGNYSFYREQKIIEEAALASEILHTTKELKKAKETKRQTIERQQRLEARGKKKQTQAGVATIMMNTLRNKAEQSGSRLKSTHDEKTNQLSQSLQELRNEVVDKRKMKLSLSNAQYHQGKLLIDAVQIQVDFGKGPVWIEPVDLKIYSGDRIAILGRNGSGKSSLVHTLAGKLMPASGAIRKAGYSSVYLDQNYSVLDPSMTVYEQVQVFNDALLEEHTLKIRLHHFLFGPGDWDKSVSQLSGGERMKLTLCSLSLSSSPPDIIFLDEPTNNLDIQNIEILTEVLGNYKGTIVIISHDEVFLQQTGINKTYSLNKI